MPIGYRGDPDFTGRACPPGTVWNEQTQMCVRSTLTPAETAAQSKITWNDPSDSGDPNHALLPSDITKALRKANPILAGNAALLFRKAQDAEVNPYLLLGIAMAESSLGTNYTYGNSEAEATDAFGHFNFWGIGGAGNLWKFASMSDALDVLIETVKNLMTEAGGDYTKFAQLYTGNDRPENWLNNINSFMTSVKGGALGPLVTVTGKEPTLPGGYTKTQLDKYWKKKTGSGITPGELAMVTGNQWDIDQIDNYLNTKQVPGAPPGVTYQTRSNIQSEAEKQAEAILGRGADPAEIHWLMLNHIPLQNISAYYEQIRDGAPWAADPDTYRNMRAQIEKILGKYGITGPVDPALVNDALKNKWTLSRIDQQVRTMAMPGKKDAKGNPIAIGDWQRVADVAQSIWDQFFPGRILDDAHIQQMLGMSPEQVMGYIRGLPSEQNAAIPAGAYYDAEKMAQGVLTGLGFVNMLPTSDEITRFVTGKMDQEAISQFYANRADLVAMQPGLPYGLTRQQYTQQRIDIEKSYGDLFGAPSDLAALEGRQPTDTSPFPTEPDWLQEIFKEGISPADASRNFADYFKRLGRAPSRGEVATFKSRHTSQFGGAQGGPQITQSEVGPTAPGLGGPGSSPGVPGIRSSLAGVGRIGA